LIVASESTNLQQSVLLYPISINVKLSLQYHVQTKNLKSIKICIINIIHFQHKRKPPFKCYSRISIKVYVKLHYLITAGTFRNIYRLHYELCNFSNNWFCNLVNLIVEWCQHSQQLWSIKMLIEVSTRYKLQYSRNSNIYQVNF